jgi:hypothetical protein
MVIHQKISIGVAVLKRLSSFEKDSGPTVKRGGIHATKRNGFIRGLQSVNEPIIRIWKKQIVVIKKSCIPSADLSQRLIEHLGAQVTLAILGYEMAYNGAVRLVPWELPQHAGKRPTLFSGEVLSCNQWDAYAIVHGV